MDAVEKANSGHPGMPMGMADVATVLFGQFLKFDPAASGLARPRPLRAVGRATARCCSMRCSISPAIADMTIDEIKRFRQLGSRTAGHPEYGHAAGHRDDHRSARPGPRQCGRHGDGRAHAGRALRRRPGRSPHLCDRRRRLPDGRHQPRGDLARRASEAQQADRAVRRQPHLDRRPDLARRSPTISSRASRASGWRGRARSTATMPQPSPPRSTRAQSGDRPSADRLPHDHRLWRAEEGRHRGDPWLAARRRGSRGRAREARLGLSRRSWCPTRSSPPGARSAQRGAGAPRGLGQAVTPAHAERAEFDRRIEGELPAGFDAAVDALKQASSAEAPKVATRQASQKVLEALAPVLPELVGGSADLTGSNNTKAKDMAPVTPPATMAAATSTTACASTAWPRR